MDNYERFSEQAEIDEETLGIFSLAKEIAIAAKESGKRYHMGGGIAIDLSVGNITRNHHDIDFHPELADLDWWLAWLKKHDLNPIRIEDSPFPETFKVRNKSGSAVVDLWPFRLTDGVLVFNQNGEYVDTGKKWDETRTVEFQGVEFRIENPLRVLDQKTYDFRHGKPMREQDIHDFKLLGQGLPTR